MLAWLTGVKDSPEMDNPLRARRKKQIKARRFKRGGSWALIVASLLVTAYLAHKGSSEKPPTGPESLALALLAAALQIGGAGIFTSLSRADPGLVDAVARRLIKATSKTKGARRAAEASQEFDDPESARHMIRRLNVELSWIEDELVEAVDDWALVHPEVVNDLEGRDKR